jgi:hypothetical protein
MPKQKTTAPVKKSAPHPAHATKEVAGVKRVEKKSAKAVARLLGLKDYVAADFLNWDLAQT